VVTRYSAGVTISEPGGFQAGRPLRIARKATEILYRLGIGRFIETDIVNKGAEQIRKLALTARRSCG
jgi:hypothetical protein